MYVYFNQLKPARRAKAHIRTFSAVLGDLSKKAKRAVRASPKITAFSFFDICLSDISVG